MLKVTHRQREPLAEEISGAFIILGKAKSCLLLSTMTCPNTGHSDDRRDVAADATGVFLDHKDFIREVIRFHIKEEDHADDFFQDFFLSLVCNSLHRDIRNIKSYLYRVITNDVMDAIHRKEKYQNYVREYTKCANCPRSPKTPVEAVVEMEEVSKVFELIEKRLPRAEAQAVRLHYRDNRDAEEIAEEMGVCVAAARGYLAKGIGRIRRLLSDTGPTAVE